MKEKFNFLVVKPFISLRLLVDFRLGQSNLVVEIRRRGSAEKTEEADDKQSDAEAQTQRMSWAFFFFTAADRKGEQNELSNIDI